jgi:glycosyltransferase involved in cell wall biosynthesis
LITSVKENAPLVSYLILSYNYGHTIGRALESVLEQTYQEIEIVIMDDSSTDNSIEVINSFSDPRVKLIRNPKNLGGSKSFNLGLTHCRGKYISNLDSDDSHHKDKTRLSVDFLESNPDVSILGTWLNARNLEGGIHSDSKEIEAFANTAVDLNLISSWIGRNSLSRSSSMVRRSVYDSIGGADPEMIFAPDYELWTRALADGHKFSVLPQRLTTQSYHRTSVTNSNPSEVFIELCYAAGRNLSPSAFARGQYFNIEKIVSWAKSSDQLYDLPPANGNFLIGNLVWDFKHSSFRQYRLEMESRHLGVEKFGTYLRYQRPQVVQVIHKVPEPPGDTRQIANLVVVQTKEYGSLRNLILMLRNGEYVRFTLTMSGHLLVLLQTIRSLLRSKKF